MTPAEALNESVITAPDYRPGLLRHIVLFQYLEATTPEQRQEIKERFHALAESKRQGRRYVPSIESGVQNSPEGKHRDLEHGFIASFESEGDRNYYVGEPLIANPANYAPAHHEFKRFVGQYLSPTGVLVFDFSVR